VVTCSHSLRALIRQKPAVFIQIVERKDTSDTQANDEEACFGPGGVCILASIHLGPGQVLGPRNIVIGCC
jgi:hypothetical protein